MKNTVTVIGAGLSGVEAANIIASNGIKVKLYEQKPKKFSPAHKLEGFCELVCSNSLKAKRINSASGLLKKEMELLGSITVPMALKNEVPAGGALAVDREGFSKSVTEAILNNPNIEVIYEEKTDFDPDEITIIATGPLTEGLMAEKLKELCGDMLSFYDAAAPIVNADSLDYNKVFTASRYSDNEGDYINCPMNKEEYELFYNELINGEIALLHDFDKIYEGCVPIEVLAKKGKDTMRFGPLKPVGLLNPHTNTRPYANLQLRKETKNGNMYNMVGFQTNLKFAEQKRIFSLIPGLENAEFERFGVMHRNSFINSPKLINSDLSLKDHPNIYIAGQLSGVEGYMESAAHGLLCGISALNRILNKPQLELPNYTMLGGLINHITVETKNFQPMGAAFGLLPPLNVREKDKLKRYMLLSERSLEFFNKEG